MRSTVGGQRTSLFAQACIASCSYYSLSSYVALFQSGVCSLAFIVPFPPIPYGNRYLLFIGFCHYLLPIVFPLKFLFQCDRCRGSLWLWGARGWVAAVPATGWSYFLGLGLQGFVCPGHLTSIFATKLLTVNKLMISP